MLIVPDDEYTIPLIVDSSLRFFWHFTMFILKTYTPIYILSLPQIRYHHF
jgi:hypothetical protein